MLTLKGEKKSETQGAVYSERSLQLGPDVDPECGVQKRPITVPKPPEAQRQVKRIPISMG
jgi:hypothetical protein